MESFQKSWNEGPECVIFGALGNIWRFALEEEKFVILLEKR